MSSHYAYVVRERVADSGRNHLVLLRVFRSEPNALLYVRNCQEADPHGVFFIDKYDTRLGFFVAEVK